MRYLKIVFMSILLFAYVANAQSKKQIEERLEKIESVKNGTTYLIVSDVNFPGHEKYLAELQKRWTLTKGLQYISVHDHKFDSPVAPGDSFFDFGYTMSYAYGGSFTYFYIRFSTLTDFSKNDNQPSLTSQYIISSSNFDQKYFLLGTGFGLDQTLFFHFDGYAGELLNYMQDLTIELNPDREKPADANKQVKNLLQDTLYIPEFMFFKRKNFSNQQSTDAEIDKIVKNYTLPYKILSQAELERKIILSPTPFYYVRHNIAGTMIINSRTGAVVYYSKPSSRNFDGDDLKKIVKSVDKS